MREMGAEFAAEFPKIAGRLTLDGFECADPYVERLLEGFAFLAARIQLKLDAEYPRFTQHLLQIVFTLDEFLWRDVAKTSGRIFVWKKIGLDGL